MKDTKTSRASPIIDRVDTGGRGFGPARGAAAKAHARPGRAGLARDERVARHSARILVVEDDAAVGASIEMLLASSDYAVDVVHTVRAGVEAATSADIDLVITDLRLSNGSGFDVIAAVKEAQTNAPVIVMTGFSSVQSAVQSLRFGAVDYIIKPFDNEEFVYAVERALNERRMRRENAALRRNLQNVYAPSAIIGQSPGMKRVLDLVRRVAPTDATVFIEGESGTGKELVAHAIHRESLRAGGPFVAVNCGAIPIDLVESELFGHAKGAFTGAVGVSEGLIMEAHGGTLFLDEVGELPPSVQVKLLRAIQEKEVRPVGGKNVRRADVRIVAASNKDIRQAVLHGEFREDLFYRLNVIGIHVPPLARARRRRRSPREALHRLLREEDRQADPQSRRELHGVRENVSLARQRARIAEPDRARRDPHRFRRVELRRRGRYTACDRKPAAKPRARGCAAVRRGLHPVRRAHLPVVAHGEGARANARHRAQGAVGSAPPLGDGADIARGKDEAVGLIVRGHSHHVRLYSAARRACFVAKPDRRVSTREDAAPPCIRRAACNLLKT